MTWATPTSKALLPLLFVTITFSCKPDITDGNSFSGGFAQQKQSGRLPSVNSGEATKNKVVVKGKYLLRVALHPIQNDEISQVPTLDGLKQSAKGCICVGRVDLNIKEDFSLEFPNSKAQCSLIGELDLSKLLNSLNDDADREKAAEAQDKMLRLKKLGPMTFDPPRPLLVGPIIQDPSQYQGLSETRSYTVQYTNKEKGGAITTDYGDITVNVLEAGSSWTPIFMPQSPFDNILRFEMLTKGFRNVPRTKGFLFDRVEFTLNGRPLAIPAIKIESKASDLMSAAGPNGAGAMSGLASSPLIKLLGTMFPVYIRLDATSFETN